MIVSDHRQPQHAGTWFAVLAEPFGLAMVVRVVASHSETFSAFKVRTEVDFFQLRYELQGILLFSDTLLDGFVPSRNAPLVSDAHDDPIGWVALDRHICPSYDLLISRVLKIWLSAQGFA